MELHNLWQMASRIGRSDCKVSLTDLLQSATDTPARDVVIPTRDGLHRYVNNRGVECDPHALLHEHEILLFTRRFFFLTMAESRDVSGVGLKQGASRTPSTSQIIPG